MDRADGILSQYNLMYFALFCLRAFLRFVCTTVQEAEEAESPKRSIRDSGYIDCWDSERSDSLSPPRHGREDSFDSLDSFGSRSQQTPSPDVLVARGSSDGRRTPDIDISTVAVRLVVGSYFSTASVCLS